MGYWKSANARHHRRDGRDDPAWPRIVFGFLFGLIIYTAVKNGAAQRAIEALLARAGGALPDALPEPLATGQSEGSAAGAPSAAPSPEAEPEPLATDPLVPSGPSVLLPDTQPEPPSEAQPGSSPLGSSSRAADVTRSYEISTMASTVSGQSPFEHPASDLPAAGGARDSTSGDSSDAQTADTGQDGGTAAAAAPGTRAYDELGHDIPYPGGAVAADDRSLDSAPDPADSIPADGSPDCPVDFPIKGNGRSGIYHPPGAFAYERTVPSICFRTAEAAERAGFRASRH